MRTKKNLFPEKALEKAPLGYRFMRSLPMDKLQRVEEPIRNSYSRKHASASYQAHYAYKPISRFRVLDFYK